jgi:Flagellar hook-length control protein
MGINAVSSESNLADSKYTEAMKKNKNDIFKSLIDIAAKNQSDENIERKVDNKTDNKTEPKADAQSKSETTEKTDVKAKTQTTDKDDGDKKDEAFENEKTNYMEQAYLARNAVDMVVVEIEPVQAVVSTAAVDVAEVTPQAEKAVLNPIGQATSVEKGAEVLVEEVLDNTKSLKTPTKIGVTIGVPEDVKETFKLEDSKPNIVVSEEKVNETQVNIGNPQNKTQTKDYALTQEATSQVSVESEKSDVKKNNLEINAEAQISVPQEKDVIVIKVGDAVTPSTGKDLAEKLGNQIVVKLDSGKNEFNAVLNPEGMGEIHVKLSMDSGKVLVSMTCSNESTKTLLENNMSSLVKIVEGRMGQQTIVNVYNEKSSGQENFDGQGNKGQYQGDTHHNQRDNDQTETDFIQKLRLGIQGMESEEV